MLKRTVILAQIVFLMMAGTAFAGYNTARRLFKKGERYLEQNDAERAFLIFREIARDHPSSDYADDAHFLIAHYYLQSKNYFQAESELLILIKNYPDSPYVDDAKAYFSRMRSRFLDDKVIDAMNSGDYKTAKIFIEEILTIDPSNEAAKVKLKEVDKILIKMDHQRRQLEEEKERIEEESNAIKTAREEVSKLRKEAEQVMEEAEKLNQQTISEYDEMLAKARERERELENRIEQLEQDLQEWRERAKKLEAKELAGFGSEKTVDVSGLEYPKIMFEGEGEDPDPHGREKVAGGIVQDKSPSIVLISEKKNEVTQIIKAELVLGLDLLEEWPKKHYLKFRVDYDPVSGSDAEKRKPTVIYYTIADMDEVNTKNSSYMKKIIVAIDRNKVEDYSVSAYFVEK